MLLNPPRLFDVLLALVRPFVDARTMGKVLIVRPTAATVESELRALGVSNAGQLAWLTRVLEMDPVPGSLPPFSLLDANLADIALPHLAKAIAASRAAGAGKGSGAGAAP